jgi:hypothetical protein
MTSPTSLLDDPFFTAELAKLDLPPVTNEIWGGVRWESQSPEAEASDDGEALENIEDAGVPGLEAPVGGASLPIGAFIVVMTLVGAAAAAVVFHSRVLEILRTLL